jgi:flagellar protein FlaF
MARLGDLDGSKIGPILDINRAIAEGLSGKPVQVPATSAAPTPQPTPPTAPGRPPAMRVSA